MIDHGMRIQLGGAGLRAGTPDYGRNGGDADGLNTDAGDAIANILHFVADRGGDAEAALSNARRHFTEEIAEAHTQ